ncbi:hypothetical protein Tco_0242356 [Tanacetum coccineum]
MRYVTSAQDNKEQQIRQNTRLAVCRIRSYVPGTAYDDLRLVSLSLSYRSIRFEIIDCVDAIHKKAIRDVSTRSNLIDLTKECHNKLTSGEIVSLKILSRTMEVQVSYADDQLILNVDESTIPSDPIVQSVDINKSTSYARVAGRSVKDQLNVNSNFRTLVADLVFDGVLNINIGVVKFERLVSL